MARVALVHDWLTGMRGGEYVLEAIAEMFPSADLFTLVADTDKISDSLKSHPLHTSRLQSIPGAIERYRYFLPLMPKFIEEFDLSGFDLVISSSHCVAKGVKKAPNAVHISYVHAPMRYVWDRFDDYFGPGRSRLPVRLAARAVRGRLQAWDRRVSQNNNVDLLIANSRFIAEQIHRAYGRSSHVIHPFVNLSRFHMSHEPREYYVVVGAFAPYKRVDLAVQAFNELKLPLKVVGSGQDERRLRESAGPTVEFLGALPNEELEHVFARAKAMVFPGKEDFGITPLEAMASGVPLIALGEGGILDTVTAKTGVFFEPQTIEALKEAILQVEQKKQVFSPENCRAQAEKFTRENFKKEFSRCVKETWEAAGKKPEDIEAIIKA